MRKATLIAVMAAAALLPCGCAQPRWQWQNAEPVPHAVQQEVARRIVSEIDNANRRAEAIGKVTWVDLKTFGRVVFFVPIDHKRDLPAGWQRIGFPDGKLPPPPTEAVKRQWTDRHAVAQQIHYQWAPEKFISIEPDPKQSGKGWCGEVVVRFEAEVVHAVSALTSPTPKPPAGMRYWTPPWVIHDGSKVPSGADGLLPEVKPPGVPHPSARNRLADETVLKMRAEKPRRIRCWMALSFAYSSKKDMWIRSHEVRPSRKLFRKLSWANSCPNESVVANPAWWAYEKDVVVNGGKRPKESTQ